MFTTYEMAAAAQRHAVTSFPGLVPVGSIASIGIGMIDGSWVVKLGLAPGVSADAIPQQLDDVAVVIERQGRPMACGAAS
ncbi:MAG: hypothetical protein ACRC7O_00795 [Fimbriiglobus sp.]